MDLETVTVTELLARAVSSNPTREAIVEGSNRLTFGEFDGRVNRMANHLHARGVMSGDRVAALLPDGIDLITLIFATVRLGAVLCPMNWRLAAPELAWQFGNLDPQTAVTSPRFQEKAAAVAPAADWIEGTPPDHASPASPWDLPLPRASDPALILYTSGTTGRPKGAVHTHGGLYIGAHAYALERRMRVSDRTLLSAPLFHVNGLSSLFITFSVGGCLVVAPQPLDIETLEMLLRSENISVWNYHPTLTRPLLQRLEKGRSPIRLRSFSMGASMHAGALVSEVSRLLTDTICFGYGQTEAGGFAISSTMEEQLNRPNLWGRPLPAFRARVIDEQGGGVGPNGEGELCLRGPAVAQGYWRNPQANAETLQDGWLRTGDMCRLDDTGMIYFAGRKKELIKSGGENVYPLEVERVLDTHPDILESCVVGVADSRWGEAVKAFIVLQTGRRPSRQALADWCKGEIADYKRPRYIEFIDAVPRDFQRKPLRTKLAALPTPADQSTDARQ